MPRTRRILIRTLCGIAFAATAFKFAGGTPLSVVASAQLGALGRTVSEQRDALLPQFGSTSRATRGPLRAASIVTSQPARGAAASTTTRPMAIKLLKAAAARHQLDPHLVLALAYWESGWDQSKVSASGAVGLMQVEPPTAAEAGPALLGRSVDVHNPVDNADVGTAVLRHDLDTFHDPSLALAAYYQGPNSLRADGMFPDTQQYVQGILALAARLNA